jgi:RNA polymerase subunit RPABC4/transcription elongation factor Spt4
MKPRRGKTRTVIKWAGAVVIVLLLVGWFGSARLTFGGMVGNFSTYVMLHRGRLALGWVEPFSISQFRDLLFWSSDEQGFRIEWWWAKFRPVSGYTEHQLFIPIWFFVLLTAIPTLLMFRTDRRRAREARLGFCRKCGYSRTGLSDDRACPECGSPGAALST